MNQKRIYHTALYLRISKEDTDIEDKKESNSIRNQRNLLRNYVQSQDDLQIFDIYIDDGYSGMDFQRPEFQRMMEDIYAGKINCVLVKDLSRLGRDYIETGTFMQKIFPAFCVRFIALTDNYDSLSADKIEQTLVLPFKNFLNDSYCRDISIKVRAQQKLKRLEGKCISAFTVYGYHKDPNDKYHLIVDDYAAMIVKMIFSWKMDGKSLGEIAKNLNDFGILSPMEYKKLTGLTYETGFEGIKTAKWAAASVKRILTNRVYLGYMEQGKQKNISYKLRKRVLKAENEWIQVKNTHQAIISETDYNIVEELMKFDGRASANTHTSQIFSGILICADCKTPMIQRINTYKGKKKIFYICQTKNQSLGCTRHSIEKELLEKIIWKEITFWLDLMLCYDTFTDNLLKAEISTTTIETYTKHLKLVKKEYDKFENLRKELLPDFKNGSIDKDDFAELSSIYMEKCKELKEIIKKQEHFIEILRQKTATTNMQLTHYKTSNGLGRLTRRWLVLSIAKIYVHENKKLDIIFRFPNKLET